MAKVRFNAKAVRALIHEARDDILAPKADDLAVKAVVNAPKTTFAYANSFEVRKGKFVYWVVNTDEAANVIEFGAREGNNPRFRPLGKALDALRDET